MMNKYKLLPYLDLWDSSVINKTPSYMTACGFAPEAIMAVLNYELSFITSGIAKLSKGAAYSIHLI